MFIRYFNGCFYSNAQNMHSLLGVYKQTIDPSDGLLSSIFINGNPTWKSRAKNSDSSRPNIRSLGTGETQFYWPNIRSPGRQRVKFTALQLSYIDINEIIYHLQLSRESRINDNFCVRVCPVKIWNVWSLVDQIRQMA